MSGSGSEDKLSLPTNATKACVTMTIAYDSKVQLLAFSCGLVLSTTEPFLLKGEDAKGESLAPENQ